MTMTLPTETATRYVVKDAQGRVTCITNELGAQQLGGSLETLTVPTESAVREILAAIPGVGGHGRCGDIRTWTVRAAAGCSGHGIYNAVRAATGWSVAVAPSGACLFVWPTATVSPR